MLFEPTKKIALEKKKVVLYDLDGKVLEKENYSTEQEALQRFCEFAQLEVDAQHRIEQVEPNVWTVYEIPEPLQPFALKKQETK